MRKYLFHVAVLLLLLAVKSIIHAQTYPIPAKGAQWNILNNTQLGQVIYTNIYKYEKDTALCGFLYSQVIRISGQQSWISPDTFLVRSQGNKIYGREGTNCSFLEYLLYDFDLALGDTFFFPMPDSGCYYQSAVVTDISFVTLSDTVLRKKIQLSGIDNGYQITWIEGVGNTGKFTGHFFDYLPQDGCEFSFTLLCFSDSSGLVYKDTIWNTCDTTIVVGIKNNEEIQKIELIVYPNPFTMTGTLYFQSCLQQECTFVLYNLLGKEVKRIRRNNSSETLITRDNFAAGMYLYKVFDKRGAIIATGKIIIQ